MTDKRADSTREIVASAEAMIQKRHASTGERLVAEAEGLVGGKKGAGSSTRELLAGSEKMLGKSDSGKRSEERMAASPRSSFVLVAGAVVAVLAIVAALAGYYLSKG